MVSYTRCFEHNGIEIYFDHKPVKSVREELKSNGWRWHPYKYCWYNYYCDRNIKYAMTLCNSKKAEREAHSSIKDCPDESTLRKYGYSVAQSGGNSRQHRRDTIEWVIEHGKMTRMEVINFLSAMISLHERNTTKDYSIAISRWEEDLEYVRMLDKSSYVCDDMAMRIG